MDAAQKVGGGGGMRWQWRLDALQLDAQRLGALQLVCDVLYCEVCDSRWCCVSIMLCCFSGSTHSIGV